jgi:hypothetical protein
VTGAPPRHNDVAAIMPFADLPPQLHERVVCSISAAIKYEIPANILLAIAEIEGGKPGQWVKNSTGFFDVGPLQFNTSYLRELRRYGISPQDIASAGCYPFDLAAWRVGQHIKRDSGDVWTRAANYHSRTPRYNAPYRAKLITKAAIWANWLSLRVEVYDITTLEKVERGDQRPAALR